MRFDWIDISYTGVARENEYGAIVWRILDITLVDKDGVVGWWPKDFPSGVPPVLDPVEATVIVTITVGATGCANYRWDDETLTHTCDGGKSLAEMILRVHVESRRLLGDRAEGDW